MQNVVRKTCSRCGKTVSLAAEKGQSCPHCGALWTFESTSILPGESATITADGLKKGYLAAIVVVFFFAIIGLFIQQFSVNLQDNPSYQSAGSTWQNITNLMERNVAIFARFQRLFEEKDNQKIQGMTEINNKIRQMQEIEVNGKNFPPK
ncbi:hypothetical protein JW935_18555 [candidate division KSB1 bacterium]|nr:hypothetical protein [candidate division KSB1 bacterium]